MRARAAVARTRQAPLVIEDLEVDDPREGEILVRLVASGVCGRDRAAISGALAMPLPFVPGCEGAGIVAKLGDGVANVAVGEAVLIVAVGRPDDPSRDFAGTRSDGSAPFQAADGPVHGFFFGQSSFATHLVCRADLAVPVADGAPLELLAGMVGDVLLGAGTVLDQLSIAAGDAFVVTGGDAVGLGACMAAAAIGATPIILADPDETRRALALEAGATIAVPADHGLPAVVRSLVAEGAAHALDASGATDARAACLASLAPGGRCAIAPDPTAPLGGAGDLDRRDGRIVTASLGPDARGLVARLVALHAEGNLPIEKLVTFFPFEQVEEALAAAASGKAVKPVVRFSLGAFDELDRALQEGAALEESGGDPENEPAGQDSPAGGEREAPPVTA